MTTAKLGVTTRMNANLGFRRGVSHAAHKIRELGFADLVVAIRVNLGTIELW